MHLIESQGYTQVSCSLTSTKMAGVSGVSNVTQALLFSAKKHHGRCFRHHPVDDVGASEIV